MFNAVLKMLGTKGLLPLQGVYINASLERV